MRESSDDSGTENGDRRFVHLTYASIESNVSNLRRNRRFLICDNRSDFLGEQFHLLSDGSGTYVSLTEDPISSATVTGYRFVSTNGTYARF